MFLQARLTVIPCQTGRLHITGIKYSLTSVAVNGPVEEKISVSPGLNPALLDISMQGRLDFDQRGPRLNNTKAEKTSVIYGPDYRLNLDVVSPMPLLEVKNIIRAYTICRAILEFCIEINLGLDLLFVF